MGGGGGAAADWQVGEVCKEDAAEAGGAGGGVCKVSKSELDQESCRLPVGSVGRNAPVGGGEGAVGLQLEVGGFGQAGDVADGAGDVGAGAGA